MGHYKYDRLSAQDTSFLIFEKPNINMHVASTAIYKAGSLKTPEGGINFSLLKNSIGDILHRIPRYRQKLKWIQKPKTAAWVDDHQFNLDYHVRHTSLPKPGNHDQLQALASRITEQQLDRTRPLWEIWIVEGLENDRFALINKIHHSMIDGASGVELSQVLMSPESDYRPEEPPVYFPRPEPTMTELWKDEYERFVTMPWQAMKNFKHFRQDSQDIYSEVKTRAVALKQTLEANLGSPDENPLNGPLGPHRILDWTSMPLEDVKAVRRALGCTVNDVVLATVTGAVRTFIASRQVHPEDIEFRVAAPVSTRREQDSGKMGNRVSAWSIPLPIDKAEPLQQLEAIHAETQNLKESKQALGVEMMMALAEWTPSLLTLGARAGGAANNTIVTNVPGPQFPLYLVGAEMEEIYPCVPLMENMGIGIALMSYNGKVCWGFNADYGRVSDIATFVKYIRKSFENLASTCGVTLSDEYLGKSSKPSKALPKPKAEKKTTSRRAASKKAEKVSPAPIEKEVVATEKETQGELLEASTDS